MNSVKHILFGASLREASDCSPSRFSAVKLARQGCLGPAGESVPATPAAACTARLHRACTEHAQCSQAHRWEFKWGQDPWETCWRAKPGQQTAPFCLTRTLEPDPESNDYKLAVVWVYSASCSHFQMFGPWEGPKPHFATQLCCLFRSFQGKC